ncbi:MAG: SGNH/GDSL hydrolase family protein [Acidimicrobiales bacterium]
MRTRTVAPVGLAAPAVTTLAWALCAWEARRARSGEKPFTRALPGSGIVGSGLGGRPVRIAWLGDSLAAGLGCDDIVDTPAHLAARLLERPVEISMFAVPGARARDVLHDQLPLVQPGTDLVVVCVGANDVASATPRARYAAQLNEVLTTLAPTPVIVLTLPDMAMADRMAQPLRGLAGLAARWFDVARANIAAAHAHVVSVDIASRPPGISRKAGRLMLCADRFHPGPEGYRVWAERIATACHQILEPAVAPTFID